MKEMTRVELRRLEMRDLNAIERIERASYPTPWSRSMFASELAKPSSICIGAFRDDVLAGYMIISRYVDAWHIKEPARRGGRRPPGRRAPPPRADVRGDGRPGAARLHARGARLQQGCD